MITIESTPPGGNLQYRTAGSATVSRRGGGVAGVVLALGAWLAPSTAHAQSGQPPAGQSGPVTPASYAGRPSLTSVRVTDAPRLDGDLSDDVWRSLTPTSAFIQRRPNEGAPSSELTEVWVAHDSQNLYFGIYVHYTDTGIMRISRVDRDQIQTDDKVTIYIDPFMDQQRAYGFAVNGYAVQRDAVLGAIGGAGGDVSWNALYETAARRVNDGWTAEMAIPFKSLRYPTRGPDEPHLWAIQLERDIEGKNEAVTWSPISSNVTGFITQMGVLRGLSNLTTSRNLELLPTVTAVNTGNLNTTTGEFVTDNGNEGGIGVKYGITSNLTFDFTFNPDFSQIGSDVPQIAVNQRFPLLFPELRPFFLEGREVYEIPGPVTTLHTRTIVDPRFGAKLTGKIGRTGIGLLFADDEAPGNISDTAAPAFEKSAKVLAVRAKYELYRESHIGAIYTDREFLDSYSRLSGIDGRFRLNPSHQMNFRFLHSARRSLQGVERSGPQWNVSLTKSGRRLAYSAETYQIDPDFGTELGFVRRIDEKYVNTSVTYRWWPESWLISWGPTARLQRGWDFTNTLQDAIYTLGTNFQFSRYIDANVNVDQAMERFRDIDFDKTRYRVGGSIKTSRKIWVDGQVEWGDQIRFSSQPFLGSATNYRLGLTLKPWSRLQSGINLETTTFTDTRVDSEVFDIKIFHAVTTYQFTDRLLFRNIFDHNTFDETLASSYLVTYRVNAGTVFFVGYNHDYQQGDLINRVVFPTTDYQRKNRAVFAKLQYLFRQ